MGWVEHDCFGDVGEGFLGLKGVVADLQPFDFGASLRGFDESQEELDGGGLTGSVGT